MVILAGVFEAESVTKCISQLCFLNFILAVQNKNMIVFFSSNLNSFLGLENSLLHKQIEENF